MGQRRHTTGADGGSPSVDEAFRAYRCDGDRRARDVLVQAHMGLAEALAERYTRRGVPRDDLRQVAMVGLLKAIDRFDPDRGTAFSSFAVPTVLGELRRHFRDAGWTVRVPRRLQELRLQADATVAHLEQRLGRRPTLTEAAAELDEPPETVLLALDGLRTCYQPTSLDARTAEAVATTRGPADEVDVAVDVERLLDGLPDRERRIVVMRFWGELTQQEIAQRMGMSQMHVSRLLRRSLRQLQDPGSRPTDQVSATT